MSVGFTRLGEGAVAQSYFLFPFRFGANETVQSQQARFRKSCQSELWELIGYILFTNFGFMIS